jgi:hypothetical protein
MPLACSELDDVLRRWGAGKAPGVWISVAIVLVNVPGVLPIDFFEYFWTVLGKRFKTMGLL